MTGITCLYAMARQADETGGKEDWRRLPNRTAYRHCQSSIFSASTFRSGYTRKLATFSEDRADVAHARPATHFAERFNIRLALEKFVFLQATRGVPGGFRTNRLQGWSAANVLHRGSRRNTELL